MSDPYSGTAAYIRSLEQLLEIAEVRIAKIRAAAARQADADYQRGWLSCSWVLSVIDNPVYVPSEHRYPEGNEPDEGLREAHSRMLAASNPASSAGEDVARDHEQRVATADPADASTPAISLPKGEHE